LRDSRPDEPGLDVLKTILHGFLNQANPINSKTFLWEQHFKLKRVCIDHRIWDVASQFERKKDNGMSKVEVAERVNGGGEARREMRYREFNPYAHLRDHSGTNASFEWVQWADGGMNQVVR
jgi:hypothetical protein